MVEEEEVVLAVALEEEEVVLEEEEEDSLAPGLVEEEEVEADLVVVEVVADSRHVSKPRFIVSSDNYRRNDTVFWVIDGLLDVRSQIYTTTYLLLPTFCYSPGHLI